MRIDDKYNELFGKYYAKLFFYATRFLDEDEAEDIVQDAFFELWERKDEVEMGEQIHSFLYKIVYTKCINVLRHKRVANCYSQAKEELYRQKIAYYNPDQDDTIRRIEEQELRKEIYDVIGELPERCRDVFRMSYLQGMKNQDIAEVLDISRKTVEAHIYKALKLLRVKLQYLKLLLIVIIVM